MQNQPIAHTQPVVQAQASIPQGNGADPATETFGSVLARQRASAAPPDGRQAATPDGTNKSTVADDSEASGEIPTQAPEITDGMLATGLPLIVDRMSSATEADDNAERRVPDAGGAVAGNGTMLAASLPAIAMQQDAGASATQLPGVAGDRKGAQAAAPLLLYGKDNASTLGENDKTAINHGDNFLIALEASGKGGATALFRATVEKSEKNMQPDSTALAALPQNGTVPLAASANPAAQLRLSTPLASNAWNDDFCQRITWMATQHAQTAELHLNPPHLGPLDVVLSVSGDQATALFVSQHAAVRNAVEQALPKLREMLADNGIMLGNATVGDQLFGGRQTGTDSKQQNGRNWPASTSEAISSGGIQAGLTVWPGRRHEGMVDTFA